MKLWPFSRTKAAPEAPPVQLLAEMGDTGLRVSGGRIIDEYARALANGKAARQWREMLDSALPGAVMRLVDLICGQVELKVDSAIAGDPAAEFEAEHIRSCLSDLDTPGGFSVVVSEMLTAWAFGWSHSEILYKQRRGPDATEPFRSQYNDGRWGWCDFKPRAQESVYAWIFDDGGRGTNVIAMQQQTLNRGNPITPVEKLWHFVPFSQNRSPEGRSAFRSGWSDWLYAQQLSESEAIGIDRDLTGVPVVELPPAIMRKGANSDEKEARVDYEDKVKKLRRGRLDGIVMPAEVVEGKETGYKLRLIASGGTGRVQADGPIRRHESRLLISMLSEFMLLGTESVGSRALADPKLNLVMLAVGALLDRLCESFNRQCIARLCTLNAVPPGLWPKLSHGEVDAPDLPELMTMVNGLLGSGAVLPSQELQRWIMSQIPGAPVEDLLEDDTQATQEQDPAAQPDPTVAGGPMDAKAADTALNGAQVTAAQGIVQSVVDGQLPRDTAVNMLVEFFNIDAARADRIMGSVGRSFTPDPTQDPQAADPTGSAPTG